MRLKNKKVLVYGLGDSGRAVIKLLKNKSAHVSFYDDDIKYYEYVGFERNPENQDYDLVVISPGIKCLNNPLIKIFKDKNIPIISEIDLAYLFCKGKIIAITGTNGKTTVSMLTNKILKEAGYKTFLCGNIGLPFSSVCEKVGKNDVVVCEVSNFQLEMSKFFRAKISCILNLKPDHLDRHGSFEEYIKTKKKLIDNKKKNDVLILNLDDEETKKLAVSSKTKFFSKQKLKKGGCVSQNQIFINKKSVLSLNNIPLKGEKNLENVLASISICSHFKVTTENYLKAISGFVPANHRMEFVGEINGVVYIDDSKATNVASTIACVEAFKDKNIFLLMGGLGKDIDYGQLFSLKYNIKKIVCFGQEGERIAQQGTTFGYDCAIFSKFEDAVKYCKQIAQKNDYVLLSPACASFDEFSSYAERGDKFKSLIFGADYE